MCFCVQVLALIVVSGYQYRCSQLFGINERLSGLHVRIVVMIFGAIFFTNFCLTLTLILPKSEAINTGECGMAIRGCSHGQRQHIRCIYVSPLSAYHHVFYGL